VYTLEDQTEAANRGKLNLTFLPKLEQRQNLLRQLPDRPVSARCALHLIVQVSPVVGLCRDRK
jgi:hypothetical protein